MTDTLAPGTLQADARAGRSRWIGRLARSVAYDALLVPVGMQTMADAVVGDQEAAGRRWRRLADYRLGEAAAADLGGGRRRVEERPARVFGYGLISSVLGLASWLLMLLTVLAVVRGPFWGFVEHGPVEPGTWGGPTRAGAWMAHGLIGPPCVVVFLFALRGIAALQSRLVRPLYGPGSRSWVLPATIVLAAGSLAFVWSWVQQL